MYLSINEDLGNSFGGLGDYQFSRSVRVRSARDRNSWYGRWRTFLQEIQKGSLLPSGSCLSSTGVLPSTTGLLSSETSIPPSSSSLQEEISQGLGGKEKNEPSFNFPRLLLDNVQSHQLARMSSTPVYVSIPFEMFPRLLIIDMPIQKKFPFIARQKMKIWMLR